MGGANVCVFTWVGATIFIDVKTHKNNTVYADHRIFFIVFVYCKQFALYYQFPFAVQTHAFLRSICRHLHFVRNHTKTHTFRHNTAQFEGEFVKFVCSYNALFALQKRHCLQ